jgi:aconitate hydratase
MAVRRCGSRWSPVTLPSHARDSADATVSHSPPLRIDTPIEVAYFTAGGVLPYVLEQILAKHP